MCIYLVSTVTEHFSVHLVTVSEICSDYLPILKLDFLLKFSQFLIDSGYEVLKEPLNIFSYSVGCSLTVDSCLCCIEASQFDIIPFCHAFCFLPMLLECLKRTHTHIIPNSDIFECVPCVFFQQFQSFQSYICFLDTYLSCFCFLYRVKDTGLVSFFFMCIPSFPITIYWKNYPFSSVHFWFLCQRSVGFRYEFIYEFSILLHQSMCQFL